MSELRPQFGFRGDRGPGASVPERWDREGRRGGDVPAPTRVPDQGEVQAAVARFLREASVVIHLIHFVWRASVWVLVSPCRRCAVACLVSNGGECGISGSLLHFLGRASARVRGMLSSPAGSQGGMAGDAVVPSQLSGRDGRDFGFIPSWFFKVSDSYLCLFFCKANAVKVDWVGNRDRVRRMSRELSVGVFLLIRALLPLRRLPPPFASGDAGSTPRGPGRPPPSPFGRVLGEASVVPASVFAV